MFPNKTKNSMFKNLAAGWKKGQAEAAAGKLPIAKPAMPRVPGLPAAVEGQAPVMPGAPVPMPAAAAPQAMRQMLPMPQNNMLKKSPWMGMKA